ncbi:chorismate mutase aro7 [Orbilia oligospora]|uniref:Chorismate mutase n=1 Tax=Orbilia oligospora TaxID=2813651 RepID=A0A6G1MJA4_ORBOL|nr:chorismate mutase aro7 [Orbilia oligospora]KAF3260541.1 chorismate mutase aro7 [Orbilia oligospora]
MDSTIDLLDPSKALDLNYIRYQLIRLEDTIIFNLIERAQFPLNPTIYTPTPSLPLPDFNGSFMEWMLYQQESVYAKVRRYQAPDEYPFFPEVKQVEPILKPLAYPKLLHPNNVNINPRIKEVYVNSILPAICRRSAVEGTEGLDSNKPGDRGEQMENYGSTAVADVAVLQALSRRIHFGKFVAEAKFLDDTEGFTKLIKERNSEEIGNRITKKKVEEEVLRRLRYKTQIYGRDPTLKPGEGGLDDDVGVKKIDVEAVVRMYRDFVIPLTKDVEVDYLLQRLETPQPDEKPPAGVA